MKKLYQIMAMLIIAFAMVSCAPDPDKLMDDLLVAGRKGDWQEVLRLNDKLHHTKMTPEQVARFSNEVKPKYELLFYENGETGEWWREEGIDYEEYYEPEPKQPVQKPVQKRVEPKYYYYCTNCHTLVVATQAMKPSPNSGHCASGKGFHFWTCIAEYGQSHGYRCTVCGVEVTSDKRPFNTSGCTRGMHQWKQIY